MVDVVDVVYLHEVLLIETDIEAGVAAEDRVLLFNGRHVGHRMLSFQLHLGGGFLQVIGHQLDVEDALVDDVFSADAAQRLLQTVACNEPWIWAGSLVDWFIGYPLVIHWLSIGYRSTAQLQVEDPLRCLTLRLYVTGLS